MQIPRPYHGKIASKRAAISDTVFDEPNSAGVLKILDNAYLVFVQFLDSLDFYVSSKGQPSDLTRHLESERNGIYLNI